MTPELLATGVDAIGRMSWGSHCCLFYETKVDVLEILATYCKAGLESGEFCFLVVAEPHVPEETRRALGRLVPDLDRHLAEGSIEIVASRDWYLQGGAFDLERVVSGWSAKLEQARARGYSGIRVAGDTGWLERCHWKPFREYEESLNHSIGDQRMAVLCTYPIDCCGAAEMLDVVRTHQFAVAKRHGSWEVIETAGHKQAKTEIARLNGELERRVEERTAQLQRSEAFLAEAQRLTRAGSFGWTPSTGELVWSSETYRIFGYDATVEPTLEKAIRRVHPEDRRRVHEVIERASREGVDWSIDHRLRMADGSVKHLHVVAHAAWDASKGQRSFTGAVMDVTERKIAESRMRQAEKMEALGRLAGGIAHDFNNILGGILGYGEMLVEDAPDGSGLKRYSQNVLLGANRARQLVDQILAYSRGQRDSHTVIDLARVVHETVELVRGSLPAGVQLDARMPSSAVPVMGDATKVHQVAMNLCMNALQAMGERGRLSVDLAEATLEHERVFQHGKLAPGLYASLTIEDSGPGMDDATLARIFEPFFTTKENTKSTGLGLALVYGIVMASAGAIDVRSEPGHGSAFTIYFPRADASIVSRRADGPPPRGHGELVLLVDNDEAIVDVTSEALTRLGYLPVAFRDAEAALGAFESQPAQFAVVVTDEVMPGLTGTQLAARIHQRRASLPVVLVSGHLDSRGAQGAAEAGIAQVLQKPVRLQDLAVALARALES